MQAFCQKLCYFLEICKIVDVLLVFVIEKVQSAKYGFFWQFNCINKKKIASLSRRQSDANRDR